MYQNRYTTISLSSFVGGNFVKFITPYVSFRDEKLKYYDKKPGDIFQIKNKSYKILTIKIQTQKINNYQHRRKVWFYLECMDCGYKFWKTSHDINFLACENCNHVAVIRGINDVATIDPWMIQFFEGGVDEARKYRVESQKMIIPICPYCRSQLRHIAINRIYKQKKIFCPYCSDKITFPEKFMSSLLRQLNIDYIREANSDLPFDAERKLYDFYIRDISCIIETHGVQHYEETSFSKSLAEQQEDDYYKFQLAINGGIQHYIVIDCRKSEIEWIKTSIMNSQLPILLKFRENDINWNKCYLDACSDIKRQIWEYYNKYYPTTKELSKIFKIHTQTINKYLKSGNELGLVKYDGKLEVYSDPIDVFYRDKLLFTGNNCADVSQKLKDLTGINKSVQAIQRFVSGRQSLKDYTFIRITNRERRREVLYGNS